LIKENKHQWKQQQHPLTPHPFDTKHHRMGEIVLDRKKMKNKRLKDHIGKDGKLKFRDCKVLFISSPQAAWGSWMFVFLKSFCV
jgi:hypothetical protein